MAGAARSRAGVGLCQLLLALVVGWAGDGFLSEALAGFSSLKAPRTGLPVIAWRLGSRPAERLRRCLGEAHGLLPPDARVTFASPPGPLDAAFFRWRWAAYLLPDLDVLLYPDPSRFVIAYQMELHRPGLTLVRELPGGGRLYGMGAR